jgi:NADH dehydrogenase
VLATFPESLSESGRRQLERLGVEVLTGAMVTGINAEAVELSGDRRIEAGTILWAAGVAASPLTETLGVERDRAGRVYVQPDLSLPGYPEVYAVGDLATFRERGAERMPGVAPNAMQTGRAAARNIRRQMRGEATRLYRYVNKGNMATIGRAAGVADLFGLVRLSGLLAWLSWLFVHIWYLIGFDNRLVVMTRWAWSYFTYQRSARLITGDPRLPLRRWPDALEGVVPSPPVPADGRYVTDPPPATVPAPPTAPVNGEVAQSTGPGNG